MNPTRRCSYHYHYGLANSHIQPTKRPHLLTNSQDLTPDMPPSWVPKLTIPRDAFDMRCPRGSKLQLYRKAQHETFALFGDCSRWDGMVEKLVLYEVRSLAFYVLLCVCVCVCACVFVYCIDSDQCRSSVLRVQGKGDHRGLPQMGRHSREAGCCVRCAIR